MKLTTWACLGWAALLAGQLTQSPSTKQQESLKTAAITGVVTDAVSGAAIPGAMVTLTGGGATRPRQMTDARGRFVFTDLPPSAGYVLTAAAFGYLEGGYRRPPGDPATVRIPIAEGQWFADANVRLWRPATISGVVRDERGEPLVGVPVRLFSGAYVSGQSVWAVGATTSTDDRGAYRFSALLPGRYLVSAPQVQISLPNGEIRLYRSSNETTPDALPPVFRLEDGVGVLGAALAPAGLGRAYVGRFHPQALSARDAQPVVVDFGDDAATVDITLVPMTTTSVRGRVLGPPDVVTDLPVRLMVAGNEALGLGNEAGVTKASADGSFVLHNVAEGDYVLSVGRMVAQYRTLDMQGAAYGPGALQVSRTTNVRVANAAPLTLHTSTMRGAVAGGKVALSVGTAPVTDLVVPLEPSVKVTGHFLWDGHEAAPESVRAANVTLESADGDPSAGIFSSLSERSSGTDGVVTFAVEGVRPGQYVFGRIAVSGYTLEAVTQGSLSLLSNPLIVDGRRDITGVVIHMTSREASVSGTVRVEGQPSPDGVVVLFPESPAEWRLQGAMAQRFHVAPIDGAGGFSLPQVIPGRYLAVAIPLSARTRVGDPAFFGLLASVARQITVSPGKTHTLVLPLAEVR